MNQPINRPKVTLNVEKKELKVIANSNIKFGEGGQGVEEAPIDGTPYSRQDSTWVPSPGASGGEANTSSNVGGGAELALPKVLQDLPFRTIVNTPEIEVAQNTQTLEFSIATNSIAFSKINQIAQNEILGRSSIGLGNIEPLLPATVRTIIDFDNQVTNNTAVQANTAKVTNANHTGQVEGNQALTVQPTMITDQALTTATTGDQIILERAGGFFRSTVDGFLGGGGETNTSSNVGLGEGLALPKSGVDLPFKSITSDTTIALTPNATELNIAVNQGNLTITSSQVSDFQTSVSANIDVTANTLKVTNATHTGEVTGDQALTIQPVFYTSKTIIPADAGDFVVVTDTDDLNNFKRVSVNDLLNGVGGGEANTTSNSGLGEGLALPKVGIDLPFKSLTSDATIALTSSATELNIAVNEGNLTITSSQVSDFQTAVSSNTDVVANTNKVSFPEAPLDGNLYSRQNAGWAPTPLLPTGGINLSYNFDNALTGDPGSGRLLVNNADPFLATQLNVSDTTRLGNDAAPALDNVQQGDYIGFAKESGGGDTVFYQVTAPGTDVGTYHTYPVTALAGDPVSFNNNNNITFLVVVNPASRVPIGGTTGQSLTKLSGADYDFDWQTPEIIKNGTPAADQIATWVDANTIQGLTSLTYSGTAFNAGIDPLPFTFSLATTPVLSTTGGGALFQLRNISVLDATTLTTIQDAITTLPSLTTATSLAIAISQVTGLQAELDILKIDSISWAIPTIEIKTYTIELSTKVGYTINNVTTRTISGSCTVDFRIDGINITGLAGLNVTTATVTDNATANNIVVAGNLLTMVVTANTAATDFSFTLQYTRT